MNVKTSFIEEYSSFKKLTTTNSRQRQKSMYSTYRSEELEKNDAVPVSEYIKYENLSNIEKTGECERSLKCANKYSPELDPV